MNYPDKYTLTMAENTFLAKRNIVDYVYNSAKLEGCNVTFPETQTILDGVNVGSVTLDDIQTVLNLRDAWRFVLSNVEAPFGLEYMCKINAYVSRNESLSWGTLRTGSVGISGTDYVPPIPDYAAAVTRLSVLLSGTRATEQALDVFLWGCRAQLFWDGNKRTSNLAANTLLIRGGAGILTIADKYMLTFNALLSDYYSGGNEPPIKRFLYDNCIVGMSRGSIQSSLRKPLFEGCS